MLRRKLLIRLGALVVVYIAGAAVAIVLLQGVLAELNGANARSTESAGAIDRLEQAVVAAREALENTTVGDDAYRASILEAGRRVRETYDLVGEHPVATGEGADTYRRLGRMLLGLTPEKDWLDDQGLASWRDNAPAYADAVMAEIALLRQLNRGMSADQQLDITRRLRNLIIGLSIASLVALNVTIILLLNTGELIVSPVEELVAHTRELARERFDHRVDTPRVEEFGQLAESYNQLAEQLRLNEQRKMDTLRQLGVSLNHELNNVINIIELQLESLDRHAKGDQTLMTKLEHIRENLHRIAGTVASLRDVRRIVTTEYADGTLMLDLPRSTRDEQTDPTSEAGGP